MSDTISKEIRSKTMRAVKSKQTKLEDSVSKELWRRGLRFRRNVESLFGKPDISIKSKRIVIFIDSCFWHGCELHCRVPKSNTEYWNAKINRNIKRDIFVTSHYRELSWRILRVWEHELKDDFTKTIDRIEHFIKNKPSVF